MQYADDAYAFQIPNSKFLIASGALASLSRGPFNRHLGRLLLAGADRIEALLQRVHQVDDLWRRVGRGCRDDLLARDLRVDDLLQPLAVLVAVARQIERLLERL